MEDEIREKIWIIMSDVFVDIEIDYKSIAENLKLNAQDISNDQLKIIFFNEVAPYCAPNMMAVIPPIWTGFAPESLIKGIKESNEKYKTSIYAMIKLDIFKLFNKTYINEEWGNLEKYL